MRAHEKSVQGQNLGARMIFIGQMNSCWRHRQHFLYEALSCFPLATMNICCCGAGSTLSFTIYSKPRCPTNSSINETVELYANYIHLMQYSHWYLILHSLWSLLSHSFTRTTQHTNTQKKNNNLKSKRVEGTISTFFCVNPYDKQISYE